MNATSSTGLDRQAWKIIGVVILAPLVTQLDSTIVNVSLSSIRDDLHSSISAAQWIISGYLLALALVLPLNGWLVDRIGTKRLYLSCFSAFTIASFVCGAARTMPHLIVARVVQGIAGGLLAPLTQLMLARVAGRQMVRVLGYAAAPILLAPLLGPILAGIILKYASWPWLFYVNLPIGVIAVFLAFLYIPHDQALIQKRPFDLSGFLMLSPGLAFLLYGFEQASHREGGWGLFVGTILIAAFLWHARRKKDEALIDLELFGIRTFSVASTTQFLSNGLLYAGQFLVPLYLISGCGLTPTQAGWLLAPMGLGMMCVYPLMGLVTDRLGCRTVAASGGAICFLGTLPFLWMVHAGLSLPLSMAAMFIRGVGQGATGVPTIGAGYASVPKDRLSYATTAMNIVQRLGGPMATTTLAIVVSVFGGTAANSQPRAYFIPFVALLILQLLVIASASRLPVRVHSV